jgi:hypothetical protein
MQRIGANWLGSVIVLFFICAAAQGQEGSRPEQVTFKSGCNYEPPEFYEQQKRLAPWFTKLNRQITNEPGFDALSRAMISALGDGRSVTCFLMVEKDGSLRKVDIGDAWAPSLKEPTDALVKRAAPFAAPPSEILFPRQVLLRFERNGQSIRVLSYLFPIR